MVERYIFFGLEHNCGHILLRVVSKSRPLPAYRAGEAGNGRDGPHDVIAAVMLKPAPDIAWHHALLRISLYTDRHQPLK